VARSNDPFWWTLFAVGGVVAAFLVPIHMVLTGIAAPEGWARDSFEYARMRALVSHPVSRLYLFVLIALPLFHWAHRFRFVLVDLGLRSGRGLVAVACYGSAIVGAILTLAVLIKL
jgi:succinate dehydrogenase subunit D